MFNIKHWSLAQREAAAGYFFITPWLIGFTLLTLGPMITSLYFSFTDYNIIDPPVWVGLQNYTRLFNDDLFWQSLRVTLYFAVLALPSSLVLGFVLAILLNQDVPAVKIWRTIFFLPSVLSGVAVTLLWLMLFNPELGVVNKLLEEIGIKGPGWLSDPNWAVPSLVIMSLWGVGQNMIVYLAGLQGVPPDLYDAARVDGAGTLQKFRYVTLPMMTPVLFYNLVLGLIGTFSYFTQVYVATGGAGGPARSTLFYNLYLYQNAFRYNDMGYASAMAWVLFVVVLSLTALVFRSSSLWVYYEGELRGRG
ncbi:MAG: sugar ABC transporter permease [Anaerolineae bacterium]|jgi:multiple sugar transport system permease protein|nr:sugar ABC transporter permease [Anaerolineae bacterium]